MSEDQHTETTQKYYDSEDAFNFYLEVWGGDDIHVGIYDKKHKSIKKASKNTIKQMVKRLPNIKKSTKLLDIGSGIGGAARYIGEKYECYVTCLNISKKQNAFNEEKIEEAEMTKKMNVVAGNFEEINFDRETFDIVWSQDAIVHSDKKDTVFYQVSRTLKPGGRFIFTDIMKADGVSDEEIAPVLERLNLSGLASVEYYKRLASRVDFERVSIKQMPDQLLTHYTKVKEEIENDRKKLSKKISKKYIDKQLEGLDTWIELADKGLLNWGILQFQKRNM